jgi:epoxyqueuosine reductase QueG
MTFFEELRTIAETWGADFFGVAALSTVADLVVDQGGPSVAGYPRAVSIGIGLQDSLVDLLGGDRGRTGGALYRYHSFSVVNPALDRCAMAVAACLSDAGYRAMPIPASLRTDEDRIAGPISHKFAAHLAGLGWIGRSCLLVTPERGPRVRWITVLTDAPLPPTGGPSAPQCGDCRACVDACPVGAFTGRPFVPGEPRAARFDAAACERHYHALQGSGEPVSCGLCVAVCPWGKKGGGPGRS